MLHILWDFFYFLGMKRRERQKDAETFHHCFLLNQHSFYQSLSSNKNIHASIFFKEKECSAMSSWWYVYVEISTRTHMCQSTGRNCFCLPLLPLIFLKHISFNRRDRYGIEPWTYTFDLKLFEFLVLSRTWIFRVGDVIGFPDLDGGRVMGLYDD